MVFEAIRRLLEGTCCLLDEDKVSAMDLFERMRMAIADHIAFEDKFLPLVGETNNQRALVQCAQMTDEHLFLKGLLEAASHELTDTHPIAFRSVLIALRNALQNHLNLEKIISFDQWLPLLDQEALTRLQKRANAGFLGLE